MGGTSLPYRKLFAAFIFFLIGGALIGCNRAGARIPGASLAFPETTTGYVATKPLPTVVTVLMPIDARPQHYDERIAGTDWTACSTDPFWTDTATSIVRERFVRELESSRLFRQVSQGPPSTNDLIIRSEIRAFCSQVVGFIIGTVAGVTSINVDVEQNGNRILSKTFERVVTDDDPEYTGLKIATIEQAMVTSMGDSLRETLRDVLKYLDTSIPR